MHRLIIAGIGVAASALIIFGCGSGSDEATAQITKAQFVKQAETICSKAREKRAAVSNQEGEPQAGNDSKPFDRVLASSMAREAEELKALATHAEDEADVARLAGTLSKLSTRVEETGLAGLQTAAFPQVQQEAAALGLKGCP